MDTNSPEPPHDCSICPRLVDYRLVNRTAHPDWWNAPVPGWGDRQAWLCIVGLAPGVSGANRTGRPFTGDHAGGLLYATLAKFGLSEGSFDARPDDGLVLTGAFISNSVRCVPPANKPLPVEIHACRPFLASQLAALPEPARRDRLGHDRAPVSRQGARRQAAQAAFCARRGAPAAYGRDADRQLSLLAAEHKHWAADGGDVRGCFRERGGGALAVSRKDGRGLKADHTSSASRPYNCGRLSRKNPKLALFARAAARSSVATATPTSPVPNSATMSPRWSAMKLLP